MRQAVTEFLDDTPFEEEVWGVLSRALFYVPGDINDPDAYARICAKVEETGQRFQTGGNVLFYLATHPSQYAQIAAGLGTSGLARGTGWRRLVIEKPFGRDLESARALNRDLHKFFDESSIYRIDHYLGKETVQNILAFRFGNGIFEPLWNRRYVNHVQITAAESIGVEGRGAYYQEAGALRDMIQNHLLQVMATIGMEPTAVYGPDAVRDERAKLLRSIRIMKPEEVPLNAVAGQYGPARIGGVEVPGFRQEPGVDPESQTDTYAAATFFVDNWRWAGVPFYLRSGKRLPRRVTDVAIQFNAAPLAVFDSASNGTAASPNLLIVRIQPEQGISLQFLSKQPGIGMKLRPVSMDFNYGPSFGTRHVLGLRNAAGGRDAGRSDALHPAGYGGGELGGRRSDPESVGTTSGSISPTIPREPGDRTQRTRCWRGAATPGGSPDGRARSGHNSGRVGPPLGIARQHRSGRNAGRACAPAR